MSAELTAPSSGSTAPTRRRCQPGCPSGRRGCARRDGLQSLDVVHVVLAHAGLFPQGIGGCRALVPRTRGCSPMVTSAVVPTSVAPHTRAVPPTEQAGWTVSRSAPLYVRGSATERETQSVGSWADDRGLQPWSSRPCVARRRPHRRGSGPDRCSAGVVKRFDEVEPVEPRVEVTRPLEWFSFAIRVSQNEHVHEIAGLEPVEQGDDLTCGQLLRANVGPAKLIVDGCPGCASRAMSTSNSSEPVTCKRPKPAPSLSVRALPWSTHHALRRRQPADR